MTQLWTYPTGVINRFIFAVMIISMLVLMCGNTARARVQIASGALHTAALKRDGMVWAWGYNCFGQLGDGTTLNRSEPVPVVGLSDVSAIGVGGSHSIALKDDGTVWAWGRNNVGQLGDGTFEDKNEPVKVEGLADVAAIAAGGYHTVVLKCDGTVWAWGGNVDGQLGDGTDDDVSEPVQVIGLTDVAAIAAGYYHTLALKRDGTVQAWGYNEVGQLGDGTTTSNSEPVPVSELSDVTALAAGEYHTVALKRDGTVWDWGYNNVGQLGTETGLVSTRPVQVGGLSDVMAIDSGGYHTAALKRDGTVQTWGGNGDGQLGDGTTEDSRQPVQVKGLADVSTIAAGYWQTFARKRDATVWAWGYNADSQLGDGTTEDRSEPVQLPLLLLTRLGDINDNTFIDLYDAILALRVLSGLEASDVRSDYATSGVDVDGDGRVGMAEALYILDSLVYSYDDNTPAKTISGAGGSSLVTPPGGLNGGEAIIMTVSADAPGLVLGGERLVSEVMTLTTSADDALFGDGTFSLAIPLEPSAVDDPGKLLLKVMLNNGASYSLLGTYDADAGVYRVELSGVISGWKVGVVEDPSINIIRAQGPDYEIAGTSRLPLAWLTDQDWKTFEWVVVNHTDMSEDDVKTIILPELWDAGETLALAGFRSPKIYIDPRLSPPARVCHLIDSNHPDGSHFHAGYIEFENGTWTYIEDQETYSTILRDDDELSALGQMYVNHDQFVKLNTDYGVSLGNIVIHELFHAVQYGYDVRKLRKSMAAYLEGTATPLGQTYQNTGGSVTGPSVHPRILRPNEHARLYEAVDDPRSPRHYTKQDFFTYVSKRYGGNSFAWTDQLFEYMSIRTANKFGLSASQYRTLYRKAMDELFNDRFGKSLSLIYREYALDRAYEHGPHSVLRPDEETEDNGFGPNHLAKTLFQWNANDTNGFKEFKTQTFNLMQFHKIEPLSCYAFS
ncbi:MAG TPA: hypothetical protein ENN79_02070, partial [Desulfobacteraceae bacterium]|nr:hypothetical protein [Desulfobacteraceae bacterium]